ncbi:MAG: zf-HC2 domain-containing protein, partial [Dehalobacterium sp.]
MECQEAKMKMFSYLDQELSKQEEEALFDHLSSCIDCGLEFSSVEETHYLLQKVLVPAAPPLDLTERVMAQIPLPLEQNMKEPAGSGFRLKQYITGMRLRWQDAWANWQLRTAVVIMS